MYVLLVISLLVLIIQLLKICWILFEPGFLKRLGFGKQESKTMMTAYHLLAIAVLVAYAADLLGYITLVGSR